MDLLLIEPQLSGFGGHHNRYVRVIGEEARKQGIRLSVACSRLIEPALKSALEGAGHNVIPAFPPIPYWIPKDAANRERLTDALASVALKCLAGRTDVRVAWLSGTAAELIGACQFATMAKVPFVFQLLEDWGPPAAPPGLRDSVAQAVSSGMKLHAQTTLLATHFERLLGAPVALFPAILDLMPLTKRASRSRPIVGIMNMLRQPKKPWPVIEALVAHGDAVSIVLHLGQGSTSEVIEQIKARLKTLIQRYKLKAPEIKIVPGAITAEQYRALSQDLDCSIMPYDVSQYRRKGSGILFESLVQGTIPIAPAGTSLALIMKDANVGVVYNSDDPMTLHIAVSRLLADIEELSKRSRDYAPVFWAENSPAKALKKVLEA